MEIKFKMKSSRPKSGQSNFSQKATTVAQPRAIEKQPSEFNILNLNHDNVNQFLRQQENKRKKHGVAAALYAQTQGSSNSLDENPLVKNSLSQNHNPVTDPTENILMSPGASSLISTPADNKKESVQVFVRVRPPFSHEVEEDNTQSYYYPQTEMDQNPLWSCVNVTPPSWLTLHNYQEGIQRDFQYSQVFGDASSQAEIFQQSALPLVFHVLNGYHGCYFVYGQTGTGKTFSMGVLNKINQESQGIIPSSLDFIFRFFEEQQASRETSTTLLDWKVHLSFYQIYQEQIQDLFNPTNKNLQVREEFGEVFVEDLVEVPVKNLHQAMTIINAGLEHRQMASQNMNLTSSRSHTILNVDVYQTKQITYNKTQQVSGRLTLVDLAGSERVRSTTSNGTRLEEAKHINASLSALGNVISSLANQKQQFIPYRSSKLTRVLQNSLSGSSKIVVLATLGPSVKNFQESLSTLQFAARCKEIQLTPVNYASIIQDDEQVSSLKEQIMDLQQEIDRKEQEIRLMETSKDTQIARLERRVEDLEGQLISSKTISEQQAKNTKQKLQQMTDITAFTVQMLAKFVETSTDQVNEAYDLNQRLLQLQQTITMSDLIRDLDQEFPFNLEYREEYSEEIPSLDDINESNLKLMVQQLTELAEKHIEHLNFLSQTSNQQILLKQFTREHLDDLQLKRQNMQVSHRDNIMLLILDLIQAKKEVLINQEREKLIKSKVAVLTERKKTEIRNEVINQLRSFITEGVLPKINFIDCGELTQKQETDIDRFICSDIELDFKIPARISPRLEDEVPQPRVYEEEKRLIRKKSLGKFNQDTGNHEIKILQNQNLPDTFLRMKLQEFKIPSQQAANQDDADDDDDLQRESNLSDMIMRQSDLNGGNDTQSSQRRRNEFTFKKQVFQMDEKNETQSSSEHVIIEEDKESDFSASNKTSSQSSPSSLKKFQSISQQPLSHQIAKKLMPIPISLPNQQVKNNKDRADQIIRMSQAFTQRCFLKFYSYFLDEDPSQQSTKEQPVSCAPIKLQSHNSVRPLIIKKQNVSRKPSEDGYPISVQSNHDQSDESNRLSFQMMRRQIMHSQQIKDPSTAPTSSIADERFTFHQREGFQKKNQNVFYAESDEEAEELPQKGQKKRRGYSQESEDEDQRALGKQLDFT